MSNTETGGRPTKDFALSIDFAKKLSMMARTEKGETARLYFIQKEKEALEKNMFQIPQTFAQALRLASEQAERIELQAKELKKQAPKIEYVDTVLNSESTYNTNLIAKELGMSAVTLNKKLRDLKVQYLQNGVWVLYHNYQNKGLTKTKTHTFTGANGETRTSMHTVWTEVGRLFIHRLIKERKQIA